MLIDEFLPTYDVVERHHIDVHAPAERVYAAVRTLDLSGSMMTRSLFLLRELPALLRSRGERTNRFRLTLDELLKAGFILLGEKPEQELLLGAVGRFWTLSPYLQRLDGAGFRRFSEEGYAKAAWNFFVAQEDDGMMRLFTETRVRCLDDASRRRFRLYWLFVRPFGGLIRKEALRAAKRKAEALPSAT